MTQATRESALGGASPRINQGGGAECAENPGLKPGANDMTPLARLMRSLQVGDRVWFEGRRRPFRVRAASSRFAVCTQPYNPMHTVNYCIVDLIEQVRGTENLVFGLGAETDIECQEMINRLVAGKSEVSHRNQVPLRIVRVERAKRGGDA